MTRDDEAWNGTLTMETISDGFTFRFSVIYPCRNIDDATGKRSVVGDFIKKEYQLWPYEKVREYCKVLPFPDEGGILSNKQLEYILDKFKEADTIWVTSENGIFYDEEMFIPVISERTNTEECKEIKIEYFNASAITNIEFVCNNEETEHKDLYSVTFGNNELIVLTRCKRAMIEEICLRMNDTAKAVRILMEMP